MKIEIIGGVYQEVCSRPNHDVVLGSAGRAAYCLAQLDRCNNIRLHAKVEENSKQQLLGQLAFLDNCEVQFYESKSTIKFEYLHPLARPDVTPFQALDSLEVFEPQIPEKSAAIVFGMIEAIPKVRAKVTVYDPQNTVNPKLFSELGGLSERLVYVTNSNELSLFYEKEQTPTESIEEMASWLAMKENAEAVVVKCGKRGAYVYSSTEQGWIQAYQTDEVFPVGSGDSFVAAFSYYWLTQNESPLESAKKASIATAHYVSTKIMINASDLEHFAKNLVPHKLTKKKANVYLASPFFTISELWMVNETKYYLESFGLDVFSPYHDIGIGKAEDVVQKDIDAIKSCDFVFAIFDGNDPGTLFEIGYARSINKPVIILAEHPKDEELKMYDGSGCNIFNDFSSAIYNASWIEPL